MDIGNEKKRLLKEYLAGAISREEMEEQVKMLNGTLIVFLQPDGTYRWRDIDGEEQTGDIAAVERIGEKYSLVLVDDILPDVAPVTSEDDLPTDI